MKLRHKEVLDDRKVTMAAGFWREDGHPSDVMRQNSVGEEVPDRIALLTGLL